MVGTILDGKYEIGALLGEGGMAQAYAARRVGTRTRVAVKVFSGDVPRVAHPNLAPIVDRGHTADGRSYVVIEQAPGRTLRRLLEREAPLPLARVKSLMTQILCALEELHAAGVTHGRVDLDRVVVDTRDGRDLVRLHDLGVGERAKVADDLRGAAEVLNTLLGGNHWHGRFASAAAMRAVIIPALRDSAAHPAANAPIPSRSAIEAALMCGDLAGASVLFLDLATALVRAGAPDAAILEIERAAEALEHRPGSNVPIALWRLLLLAARLHDAAGRPELATRAARRAHALRATPAGTALHP
jgi:hypothetical protein